jgi:phospholipase C
MWYSPLQIRALAILVATAFLCSCRGSVGAGSPSGLPVANLPPSQAGIDGLLPDGAHKIQHIIIVVQENRSFNNLFYGYPGAKTAKFGFNSKNQKIVLQPVGLETTWDLQHNAQGFLLACNGTGTMPGTDCRMNGFDKQTWTCGHGGGEPKCPNKNPPYSYVPHDETVPYFTMAHQYVLADEMFASDWDTSSFISHQYIIAAKAPENAIDYPSGNWGCPFDQSSLIKTVSLQRKFPIGFIHPCWNPETLGDELDKKGLSWAFYATPVTSKNDDRPDNGRGLTGIWSAYQAIKHIWKGGKGQDWKNDVSPFSPPATFLSDVKAGKLRAVTWITPTYANSDHGGSGSKTGPAWVTSIVNAVGESKYWNTSAIFIFWDDSGGWYDAEKPAYEDYDGLGFRLPLLIISPYAEKGHVSHVHYEHGSIVKFVEDQFGLPRLADSDARANSLGPDCFDFAQPPRKFVKIAAPFDQAYFMRQPIDDRPPDTQ